VSAKATDNAGNEQNIRAVVSGGKLGVPVVEVNAEATCAWVKDLAWNNQMAPAATGRRFLGFSARETTGAASAAFRLHNGTTGGDTLVLSASLAAAESTSDWFGPQGVAAEGGIFFSRISGTIDLIVYYADVEA